MNKEERQAQLKGMFDFLKGLEVRGLKEFSSYDEYKKAPVVNPGTKVDGPRKYTGVEGNAGMAIQRAIAEREEWFNSLSPEEKAEYERVFGD